MFHRVVPAAVLALTCAGVVSAQEAAGRPAIVAGRVVDHVSQNAIAGARLSLQVGQGATLNEWTRTSDDQGRFELEVPAGEYILSVSAFGYQTFEDSLHVDAATNVRLVIRLSASPIELEPIMAVTARRPPFMDGFEERRARGRTHTAFFTADEIEARNPRGIAQLFTMVPGAYVRPGHPFGDTLVVAGSAGGSALRGGCHPDVWVDGHLMGNDLPVDEIYPPSEVEAIELYSTRDEIPSEFVGPNGCGALVIWLRERDSSDFLPTWSRWLVALGAVVTTVLLAR